MNVNEILNAITSVGFPITACVALFYLYDHIIKDVVSAMLEVKGVLNELRNAIDNVISTLNKIDDKLDSVK